MADDGDGRMALQLIRDHLVDCTNARKDNKDALREIRSLLYGVIAFLVGIAVTFGGYEYVQSQNLSKQLTDEHQQTVRAVQSVVDNSAASK